MQEFFGETLCRIRFVRLDITVTDILDIHFPDSVADTLFPIMSFYRANQGSLSKTHIANFGSGSVSAPGNFSRLSRRARREAARRAAAAAYAKQQERLALSAKLREKIRSKRRDNKYVNLYQEQSGPIGPIWPYGEPSFHTRKESIRAAREVNRIKFSTRNHFGGCGICDRFWNGCTYQEILDLCSQIFEAHTGEKLDEKFLRDHHGEYYAHTCPSKEYEDWCRQQHDGEIQKVRDEEAESVGSNDDVQQQAGFFQKVQSVVNFGAASITAMQSAKVVDTAAAVSETVRELGKTASSVESCINEMRQMFSDMYTSFMQYVPKAIAGALLIAFVFWISGSQRIPPIMWTAVTLLVAQLLGKEAWNSIREYLNKPVAVEEQAGMASPLAACLVAYLLKNSFQGIVRFPDTTYWSSIFQKDIATAPRVFSSLKSAIECAISIVESVVNWVREQLKLAPIRLAQRYGEDIDRLVVEVAKVVKYEMSTEPKKEAAEIRLNRIMNLHNTCWGFKNAYRSNREVIRELEVMIQTLTRWAMPLRAAVGGSCGFTQLPVSVCLYGDPGVGKTMMMQNLNMAVLKQAEYIAEDLSEDQATKLLYVKPFNSEYLDGYYDQPVFVIDDFMAKKATPSDSSNAMFDLMTYYSSMNNIVNKAECSDKGMWAFASKIIFMTTNLRHLDEVNASQCLLSPAALQRRVDLHYHVIVKPEYRIPGTTKLDYYKFKAEWDKCVLTAENALQAYPWHVWEIFPTSWSGTEPPPVSGQGKPFVWLVLEMVRLLRERKQSHVGSLEAVKYILKARRATDEELHKMLHVQEQAPEIEAFEIDPCDEEDPDAAFAALPVRRKVKTYEEMFHDAFNTDIYDGSYDEVEIESHIAEGVETDFEDEVENFLPRWQLMRKRLRSTFSGIVSKVAEFFKTYGVKIVLGLGLAAGALAFLYSVIKGAWKALKALFYPPGVEEQSNRPKSRAVRYAKLQEQGGYVFEGNHRMVYNNSFKLCAFLPSGDVYVFGQVTYLEMDYLVMPNHFDTRLHDLMAKGHLFRDSEMFMRSCRAAEQVIKLQVGHFLDFPRSTSDFRDLCFIRTTNLHCAKKIVSFLLTEQDYKDAGGLPVRLDTARVEKNGELVKYNERIAFMSKAVEVGTHGITIGKTRHTNWLSYDADCIMGDCGAPLCLQAAQRFQHRVWLGIHVGCKIGFGQSFSTQLTAELVADHLVRLKKSTNDPRGSEATLMETVEQSGMVLPAGFDLIETDIMPFRTEVEHPEEPLSFGSFSCVGELTRVVSAPVRTNLTSTFVFEDDMLEDVMPLFTLRPMRLSPYLLDDEMVYPSVVALKPYAGDVISIDLDLVRRAVPLAMKPFSDNTLRVSSRVWSVEGALVGANGAKGIPLGTSVGLPGCLDHRNKRSMLGGAMEFDFTKDEVKTFVAEVRKLEDMCKKGIRPFFMARGFLKDELRKPGKSARYIAGTNVHYYTLCRMYFGQIVSTQMNQFKDSGMCPGINPYKDWEWLQNFVTKKGEKVWDGDFSGFDTSQQPQMLGECLSYINSWYTARGASEADNAVRTILFQDLMKSRHAVGKGVLATHVVQWQRSLPSGHFLTTFINSMLSMVCIVSAFIKSTGRYDFWEVASAATLGDDNLVGASDEVIEDFNQVSVAKVLKKEFNMVYTAGRKGEDLMPYLSIDKVTFLQRSFRMKRNVVVGPIRKESIFGALMYTKKGDRKYRREVMCQNIEGALSELSLWPEEEWSACIGKILLIAKTMEYSPRFLVDSSQDYFKFTCERDDTGWF